MAAPRPTVRTIAAALGLSRATVSNALRGYPGVSPITRKRVQAKAASVGYVTHPFAAEVMSQLRRAPSAKRFGTLAVLEMCEPSRPPGATGFNADLLAGVKKRASSMGFGVNYWSYGVDGEVTLKRLDQILHWRGIKGVVLLPTWSEPDFRALNWSRLTGIYVDYLIRNPPLHTVCSDHFRTLFNALEKARKLGYRRLGFAVANGANARIHGRWVAAFLGHMHAHPELQLIPPLVADELTARNFLPWFHEHKPDVLVTHWVGAYEQMISAGADIPKTHGFICLNLHPAPSYFSGFMLQPKELGARATELLVSQLTHREWGTPTLPSTTTVPSIWHEGKTVRQMS